MKIYKLSSQTDFQKLFSKIDIDKAGSNILAQKSKLNHIFIKDLKVGGANILKQEALSIGADLAVPRGTILAQNPLVDCVLIVSNRDIIKLSNKLKIQPFGLKELSIKLLQYINIKPHKTKIMGVINTNDDSFYSGSRYNNTNITKAIKQIKNMINDGADIIDIGGVSSRPGSQKIEVKDELKRVSPIIDAIMRKNYITKQFLV
jgi:dihydropteroate synthase